MMPHMARWLWVPIIAGRCPSRCLLPLPCSVCRYHRAGDCARRTASFRGSAFIGAPVLIFLVRRKTRGGHDLRLSPINYHLFAAGFRLLVAGIWGLRSGTITLETSQISPR